MAFNDILTKPYARKVFYTSILLLTALIIVLRFFAIPNLQDVISQDIVQIISQLLDTFLITVLVTVFIGSYLFWITPKFVNEASIEIIEPRDLPNTFQKSLESSTIWLYKGGCGRYFRTKTLPTMAKNARLQSLSREIIGIVLDPTDSVLCRRHAEYRNSTRSTEIDGAWSEERVRAEVYTTILTVIYYQQNEKRLRIELALSKSFSGFRIDLGSQYAILTREDRLAPAMKTHEGSYFYRSFKEEIYLFKDQHKIVPTLRESFNFENITPSTLRQLIENLGLSYNDMDDAILSKIIDKFNNPINPYA